MNDSIEISAKTVNDAITEATIRLGTSSDNIEYEVIEKGNNGFLGIGAKNAVIRVNLKFTLDGAVKKFLLDMFKAMNMEVNVEIKYDDIDKSMDIELSGDEMGVLIGKRGQTLDSIQYLASLVANKYSEDYIRVKVDTEDYRKRRRDTLENLAKNIAYKVKRTRRSVSLEPMNPYERRVIHAALQNDGFVVTHSEGEEPFRYVVVAPKRENRGNYQRTGSRTYGGYRKNYNNSYNKKEEYANVEE